MQNDEMIWQVLNDQFCSFKTTIGSANEKNRQHFCRNEYSITGLCNRIFCPLANSKYATIREKDGRVTLFIKTVERAHSPKNLWEKIPLSRNYAKALAQLDEHLLYFPSGYIHRIKQRLTKIHQYMIRMRKIELKKRAGMGVKYARVHRKVEQREERREQKAMSAANLEKNIEKELIERLSKGTYGDIYNFPEIPYQNALENAEADEESDEEEEELDSEEEMGLVEYVEDLDDEDESESEEELEDLEDLEAEVDSDENDSDDDADNDDEDSSSEDSNSAADRKPKKQNAFSKKSSSPKKPGTRVEIEYEDEDEEAESEQNMELVGGLAW